MDSLKNAMVSLLNQIQCAFVSLTDSYQNEMPEYRGSTMRPNRLTRKTTAALRPERRFE